MNKNFSNEKSHINLDDYSDKPILSGKEQRRLIRKYKEENDTEAKDLLVESNLRLVYSIVTSIKTNISIEDLFQEGVTYLLRAIEKFDLNKKSLFSTYVYTAIKRGVKRYIEDEKYQFDVSIDDKLLLNKLHQLKKQYKLIYGQEISVEEIAQSLDISIKEAEDLNAIIETPIVELDKSSDKEGYFECKSNNLVDSKSDFEDLVILKNSINVDKMFAEAGLNQRDIMILKLYFGINSDIRYNCSEIARIYNVRRQFINLKIKRILLKIRKKANLASYLDYTLDYKRSSMIIDAYQKKYYDEEFYNDTNYEDLDTIYRNCNFDEETILILNLYFGLLGYDKLKKRDIADELNSTVSKISDKYNKAVNYMKMNGFWFDFLKNIHYYKLKAKNAKNNQH